MMQRNGENYYYLTDALGSVTALADKNGAVVQTYSYSVFGEIINQTGTLQNSFTYTGREWDSEVGLYYYRARFYDARVGRFLSEDPLGMVDGTNVYCYVANLPNLFVDPMGLNAALSGALRNSINIDAAAVANDRLEDAHAFREIASPMVELDEYEYANYINGLKRFLNRSCGKSDPTMSMDDFMKNMYEKYKNHIEIPSDIPELRQASNRIPQLEDTEMANGRKFLNRRYGSVNAGNTVPVDIVRKTAQRIERKAKASVKLGSKYLN